MAINMMTALTNQVPAMISGNNNFNTSNIQIPVVDASFK